MTTITQKSFGTTAAGEAVQLYTLKNEAGMEVDITDLGGIIVSIRVQDKNGKTTDVVLGHDNVADYENGEGYIGALIGRHGNRIAKGKFTLNGKEYSLYCNDGANHLHGGKIGFDKKIWKAEAADGALRLTYLSPDGEEGYPGNLSVTVVYSLDEDNALTLDYQADTDADTVCNLTNHAYFNLGGCESGSVLNQKLRLFADRYTCGDGECLTTGEIASVEGTPMDLRELTVIGAHINDDFDQLRLAGGYDHNFIVNGETGTLRPMAEAEDDTTGITLSAYTTQPSVQLYSGNFLKENTPGKNGSTYGHRWGFCLESQYYPNALCYPHFPQPILKKDEHYHHVTVYRFGLKK